MTSASRCRLLEDVVKSEDAVEFKDGPELVSKELVERLAFARTSVSSGGANQENLRDGRGVGHRGQSDGQVDQCGGGEIGFDQEECLQWRCQPREPEGWERCW